MAELPSYGQPIARVNLQQIIDSLAGFVVTSVSGTANQVAVSPSPGVGAVTVSLPSGGTLPGAWHAATGFTVDVGDHTVTAGNLVFGAASARIIPGVTSLLFRNNANSATNLSITDAGVLTVRAGLVVTAGGATVSAGNVDIASDAGLLRFGAAQDGIIARDAANILAQRNGTTNQEFRIYNTFTSLSAYERGVLRWSGNEFQVFTEAAGGGTGRLIRIRSAGVLVLGSQSVSRWQVDASGNFSAVTDNAVDIGALGATRPRSVYVATNVGVGSVAAFGTGAAGVIGIFNGTEPSTSPADMVQLYSVDLSAGNATLGLRTETAVAVDVALASTHSLQVRLNGATFKVLLATP